jgi:hypothetical protein
MSSVPFQIRTLPEARFGAIEAAPRLKLRRVRAAPWAENNAAQWAGRRDLSVNGLFSALRYDN